MVLSAGTDLYRCTTSPVDHEEEFTSDASSVRVQEQFCGFDVKLPMMPLEKLILFPQEVEGWEGASLKKQKHAGVSL